jgi:RimJ/RimL family protein N-acetyltransferase
MSRRIQLRPATTSDQTRFVETLLRTGLESFRPTTAGTARATSWNAAFLVTRRADAQVLGFSTLHGLDQAGHIRSGIYLDPQRSGFGIGSEAVALSINYAFAMFDIDTVLAQTTEASFGSFGMTAEDIDKGSVMYDHLFFRGKHWDLHTFRISREEWQRYLEEKMDAVLPSPLDWRTPPHRQPAS